MPHYFFDLYSNTDALDEQGKEFPDLAAARANATVEAREMMTQAIHDGELNLNHRIDVRDESGAVIYVLRFADAVRVTPEDRRA